MGNMKQFLDKYNNKEKLSEEKNKNRKRFYWF
jgi:hypothetical protein